MKVDPGWSNVKSVAKLRTYKRTIVLIILCQSLSFSLPNSTVFLPNLVVFCQTVMNCGKLIRKLRLLFTLYLLN